MVDLNKNEYVYLLIVRTLNKTGNIIDVNVHPFKTEKDIKHAMINCISNNARNYKFSIDYIAYSNKSIVNTNIVASARIDYNSGMSKTYEAIRRCIEEVK